LDLDGRHHGNGTDTPQRVVLTLINLLVLHLAVKLALDLPVVAMFLSLTRLLQVTIVMSTAMTLTRARRRWAPIGNRLVIVGQRRAEGAARNAFRFRHANIRRHWPTIRSRCRSGRHFSASRRSSSLHSHVNGSTLSTAHAKNVVNNNNSKTNRKKPIKTSNIKEKKRLIAHPQRGKKATKVLIQPPSNHIQEKRIKI
jgi:hypothetical protein